MSQLDKDERSPTGFTIVVESNSEIVGIEFQNSRYGIVLAHWSFAILRLTSIKS